jgi:ligand-binding sensor domain-containing protein/signal transduction histidine kinase/CheY-like chemotaxis protein/AraC-like DNA-binding protein
MRPLLIITIYFTLFVAPARAQRLDFAHLNVENGLSQKSVLAITQDSQGFLWFGTADGLNRYDSRNFKTYIESQSQNGLSSSYILSLLSDSKQTLWVGTSHGLYKYRPQTDDFEPVRLPNGDDGKDTHIINCITEDRFKRTWVGTTTGLYVLQHGGKALTAFYSTIKNGLAGNNIHSITEDDAGNMWIGTDKGLTMMKPRGDRFLFETFNHHNNEPGSLGGDNITSIAEDEYHNLWIGMQQKGLDLYNAATKTFTHYTSPSDPGNGSDNIRKVISGNDGKLWIATQDGLSVFDIKTRQFFTYKHDPDDPKSLNQNSLYSLFIDNRHTLWVGTYFGGINIATPSIFSKYQSNSTHSGISNNVISSIVEDGEHNLWIGTEGGGLNYIHTKDKKVDVYQHQKNNAASISSSLIKVIYKDRDGNIWTGTHGGGLNVLPPKQNSFIKYLYSENNAEISNSEIRSIGEDANGLFWIGTNTGLKIFRRNKTQLTPFVSAGLPGLLQAQPINCLFLDSKNTMWAGSWGLFTLEKGTTKVIPFQSGHQQNSILNNVRINCIMEDSTGNIWFGTDRSGLFKYNILNKHISNYTENEGLANNNVYGIVQDEKGNMWISTGNGLSNLNIKTGIFHNYTTRDGLAGNDFNKNSYARLTDGEILFGGFNGFTGFYPKNIKESNSKPIAFITGLKLFNKPVEVGDENKILSTDISRSKKITLRYTQNVFTIDFVILNYIRAEKNKYAYQIENIDKNWNYTNIPSATYNNLPPGKYHFLAKGRNNDGIWSDPVSILISVQPPWWLTWWAYSLYILAIAAIVFLIIRFFFLRELLKRDKELTELKLNFFNNISHEIRTYLSLISAPVEKLLRIRTEADDDTHQLQMIKKNSDELLQLVNELMDFRKAETGNLSLHVSKFNMVPFLQSICQSFEDIALSKNIVTDFISPEGQIDLYFDKEQMKKVFFNLLSNAYKFTPDGGRVCITIEDQGPNISIKVADNGKGISPENITKLFYNYFQENDYGHQNTGYGIGLALSKSIIELHKGELKVESNTTNKDENVITVFTIILKKGDTHFGKEQVVTVSPLIDFPENDDPVIREISVPAIKTNGQPSFAVSPKYSLLIVEDNPDVRGFIADSFKEFYHIYEAANGAAGFEIATEQIPDLIISDVMMPEMDGYTFCRKIKTDERTDHIPVILLTAKASITNQVSGLEMGADVYLTKPFSIQILELQVQNLIASAEKLRKRYSEKIITLPLVKEALNGSKDCAVIAETIVINEPIVENEFINKIIALAETHISNPDFDVEMLCRNIGMSQTVLYKKVKALTGLTINEIVKKVRFKKAAELISQNQYTVYEVADMVGYNDTKYFSREFKKQFGVSPRDYKQSQI